MTNRRERICLLDPGAICRVSDSLMNDVDHESNLSHIFFSLHIWLLLGSVMYGVVFGIWRSPLQAVLSAIKMPVFMLTLTAFSVVINTMLAQVVGGVTLTFRKVSVCIVLSLTITAIVMGSLSPVMLFFTFQFPAVSHPEAMNSYRTLLVLNTLMIGVSGVIGNACLFRLLEGITASRKIAARVLISWILVTGLVGAELAWIMSPFLARPDIPVPFFNPNALQSNFFEYLMKTITEGE